MLQARIKISLLGCHWNEISPRAARSVTGIVRPYGFLIDSGRTVLPVEASCLRDWVVWDYNLFRLYNSFYFELII
jgi:hypothetical protein